MAVPPLEKRTFARNFRQSMVRTDQIIRTRRLTDIEVSRINRILKARAQRHIAAGRREWLYPEQQASGIKARHVVSKVPILDPEIMAPRLAERPNEEISILAEMGVTAARQALARAGREAKDVDAVLCACSNLQRAYPAIAVEIQDALSIDGRARA